MSEDFVVYLVKSKQNQAGTWRYWWKILNL